MRLDRPAARRITADWARAFPSLTRWRPLVLLRRLGPLVQGITLERSSSGDDYLPVAHVHALTRDFGDVSMTLGQHMVTDRGGVQMRIKVVYHDEEVAEAVQRLRAQSRLPLDRVPTLDEVLAAYRENILSRQHEDGLADAIPEVEDLVLIPAERRRPDLVREALELARTVVAGWRYTPLGPPPGREWLDDLTRRAEAVDELDAIVAGQVAQLKLDKLPDAWQSAPQG